MEKQLRLMFFNNNGGNAGSGNDETVTQFGLLSSADDIVLEKKPKEVKQKNIKQKSKRKTWWRFGVSGIEASQPSGDKK